LVDEVMVTSRNRQWYHELFEVNQRVLQTYQLTGDLASFTDGDGHII
jgi:hypothetical protein